MMQRRIYSTPVLEDSVLPEVRHYDWFWRIMGMADSIFNLLFGFHRSITSRTLRCCRVPEGEIVWGDLTIGFRNLNLSIRQDVVTINLLGSSWSYYRGKRYQIFISNLSFDSYTGMILLDSLRARGHSMWNVVLVGEGNRDSDYLARVTALTNLVWGAMVVDSQDGAAKVYGLRNVVGQYVELNRK